MSELPEMHEFRTELTEDGILHLIFDAPGRSMNVFSNRAIREAEAFADWLKGAEVTGVVIRSGKPGAFCAGADLSELSTAYDMIMATPEAERDARTVEEFAPIGRAFRKLETAGKPVAIAINGLALGGGCEAALAAHYRVLTDDPSTAMGLPESVVGLLPGGGGTQRLPRLTGIAASLPILLEGGRFSGEQAVRAGAAHEVVAPGQEIAAAEAWILSSPDPRQPWDRPDWSVPDAATVAAELAPIRERVLAETGGHYPAPLAILDCLERGLPVDMDRAVAEEIDVFKDLVQRIEPRNMIGTMFLGRVDYDRKRRKDALPAGLDAFVAEVKAALQGAIRARGATGADAAAFAGLAAPASARFDVDEATGIAARKPAWFDAPSDARETTALALLAAAACAADGYSGTFTEVDRNLADYAAVRDSGFPAYLGGPFAMLERYGAARLREMAGWGRRSR